MAEQWDYEMALFIGGGGVLTMSVNGNTTVVPSVTAGLREMGSKGWELVNVNQLANTSTAYFKRRKQ